VSAVPKTFVYMADVTPMSRTRAAVGAEPGRLDLGPAEELHQQGTGHVEALGHRLPHRGVHGVPLAGDLRQTAPDPPRRQDEERQQGQRQHGDLPREHEHRGHRRRDPGDVADDGRQRGGEGLLRPADVAVEPADEGAGLGPAEERDGHALHVVEDPGT